MTTQQSIRTVCSWMIYFHAFSFTISVSLYIGQTYRLWQTWFNEVWSLQLLSFLYFMGRKDKFQNKSRLYFYFLVRSRENWKTAQTEFGDEICKLYL